MTTQELKDVLSRYKKSGRTGTLPLALTYKGLTYSPLSVTVKNRISYAVISVDGKDIKVCIETSQIYEVPAADESYSPAFQKPKLKEGDYVRVHLDIKKMSAPMITENMKSQYNNKVFKIESLNPYGFYRLTGADKYIFSDKWLTRINKKEYDEELLLLPLTNVINRYLQNQDQNINRLNTEVRDTGIAFTHKMRTLNMALDMKHKNTDEIMNEKKEQALKDLAYLHNDKRLESISLENECLVIITKQLEITQTNVPILKKFTKLFEYKIIINLSTGNTNVYCHNSDELSKRATNISYCHPHIPNGSGPCMGNMHSYYHTALAQFKLKDAVMILLDSMQAYYSGSDHAPYVKISDFFKDTPRCENCNERNVHSICTECSAGTKADSKDFLMPKK
jgi:hypothetical protein